MKNVFSYSEHLKFLNLSSDLLIGVYRTLKELSIIKFSD